MRFNKIFAGLLMAGATVSALAQSDGVTGNSMISKVDTVFVREARGLYIEKKLLHRTASKDLWVEVRSASSLPGDPKSELFRVPADIAIERGDLVTMRTGDSTASNMNLLPESNKVTQVVAKYDTLMAMTFGLPKSRQMLSLFVAAKAQ
jgi:hypothetical protein